HWGILVTGGFIVALASLYEHLRGEAISGRLLWLIVIGTLFIAVFKAWRKEHYRANEYGKRLEPKLEITFEDRDPYVEILEAQNVGNGRGDYKIVRVRVENIGGEDIENITATIDLQPHPTRSYEDNYLTALRDSPIFMLRRGDRRFNNVAMREV